MLSRWDRILLCVGDCVTMLVKGSPRTLVSSPFGVWCLGRTGIKSNGSRRDKGVHK